MLISLLVVKNENRIKKNRTLFKKVQDKTSNRTFKHNGSTQYIVRKIIKYS